MTPARPVLRYHGGKWRLAPWIISHFPPHKVYVEPYGGAASVLLRKQRAWMEVYNDLDGSIVNVFRILRDPETAARLHRALELTPYARAEFELSYEPSDDPVEWARRTITQTFLAVGTSGRRIGSTGFRACAMRDFSRRTQTGASDWRNYPRHLGAIIDRLRGVVIECRDALEVIAQQDGPDTLFYLDPPYVPETRSRSNRSRAYMVERVSHRDLAEVLHRAQGMIVLSGYPSDLYGELFGDWSRIERPALGDHGARRTEVLWLNRAAVERGEPLFATAYGG